VWHGAVAEAVDDASRDRFHRGLVLIPHTSSWAPLTQRSLRSTRPEGVATGAMVEVRTRYAPGHWANGYEVAETLPSGYRIRRCGTKEVLSDVFSDKEVRLDVDPPEINPDRVLVRIPKEVRNQVESHRLRTSPIAARSFRFMSSTARREASAVIKLSVGVGRAGIQVGRAGYNVFSPLENLARPVMSIGKFRLVPRQILGLALRSTSRSDEGQSKSD
jgi:hypothetical protein